MTVSLPYPNVPTNGQALDATPMAANILALLQAIQSFDGSQITAGSVVAAAMNASINPNTMNSERGFDFVSSGCVWSGDSYASTLNGSMTSGIVYINGIRVTVSSITAHAFTASKDTYVDVDVNGNITYTAVSNNAASPALAANSIRLGIIISGAGSIAAATSVNQGQESMVLPIATSTAYTVSDSLGNLICPRDVNRKLLGMRAITSDFTISSSQTTQTQVTGLSCPVIVPTSRKIKVTVYGDSIQNASSGQTSNLQIWEGVVVSGTSIATARTGLTTNGEFGTPFASAIRTPSSASQTYNVGIASSGATNVTFSAGSGRPAVIKVELD